MEDFNSDIEKIMTDFHIISYFTINKKSIFNFIKTFIEVDKIIAFDPSDHSKLSSLDSKLDDIKHTLISNNTLLQSKLDNIKNITNNELKNMFIDLQQSLFNGSNTTELKQIFDNFKDRIEILNNQNLNDIDKKNLDVLSNLHNSFLSSFDQHHINHKINSIEQSLNIINENFSTNSSKKGQAAETALFNILTNTFPDTEVLDMSHTPNSGDIHLIKNDKPKILIDSKNFGNKTVPKRDLDKFYNDIQHNNCSGILCNTFGGIANKQHFEIDIIDKNIIVFLHSHQFDPQLFKLATNIIYNMHQELRDKQNDSIILDQKLYQNIKIEYNYYIQTFRHHLDIIKSNVNSLSQLSFTLLDNFFKRKITNIDFKHFICHICSAQLSTEKILKTHLKKIHQYTPN